MSQRTDSLADLQAQFLALLFDPAATNGIELIRRDAIPAQRRLDIYRNTLRGNFHDVLALEFPVIQQLSGADYFRQLAEQFQRTHPSNCGNLHHVGEPFAAWLTQQLSDTDFRWFGDVARLEWSVQQCEVAPDALRNTDFSALANLSPSQQQNLRWVLHPASRVLRSRWPVLSIWNAHQHPARSDAPRLEDIDLNLAENMLVLRQDTGHVMLHALGAGEAMLLQSLAQGATLGAAVDAAQHEETEFDATAALQHAARLGLLCEAIVRR